MTLQAVDKMPVLVKDHRIRLHQLGRDANDLDILMLAEVLDSPVPARGQQTQEGNRTRARGREILFVVHRADLRCATAWFWG